MSDTPRTDAIIMRCARMTNSGEIATWTSEYGQLERELAEFGQFIIHPLLRRQVFREIRKDTACQRNILEAHLHAGNAHKGFHDGQQGKCGQRWRLIYLGPDDFEF